MHRNPSRLQASLEPSALRRNLVTYENAMGYIFPGGRTLREWMKERFRTSGSLRFLDVGCGRGEAVSYFSWHMPRYLTWDNTSAVAQRLEGIGLDIHLHNLSQYSGLDAEAPTRFVEGSVETMEGIESDSIDIGVGYAVLRYVDDKLAAIRSGWRVLKEGGIFVWLVYTPAFIEQERQLVTACDNTQHSYLSCLDNDTGLCEKDRWWITQKSAHHDGIPAWKFSGAKRPRHKAEQDYERFDRVSCYTLHPNTRGNL